MTDIQIQKLILDKSHTKLSDPLSIHIEHGNNVPKSSRWYFSYILDMSSTRHVIDLGSADIQEGQSGFTCSYQMDGWKQLDQQTESLLKNIGLLVLVLKDSDKEIFKINCVTYVEEKDKELWRNIMNPMDE